MSGNAGDGVIRINTDLDTTGFNRQAQRLESAVSSLARQVMGMGRQLNSALANGASQRTIENLRYKMHDATVSVGQLQTRLSELANSQVRTRAYDDLARQINRAETAHQRLIEKERQFITLHSANGETAAQDYARYTAEIQRLETQTMQYGESLTDLYNRITAAQNSQQEIINSANYQEVTAKIRTLSDTCKDLGQRLINARAAQSNLQAQMATMDQSSSQYRFQAETLEEVNREIESLLRQTAQFGGELHQAKAEQQALLNTEGFYTLQQEIDNNSISVRNLENYLQQATNELEHYTQLRDGITGDFADTPQWRTLQYNIQHSTETLETYREQRDQLASSGNQYFFGRDTQSLQQMDALLGQLSSDLEDMSSDAASSSEQLSGFRVAALGVATGLVIAIAAAKKFASIGTTAFKTLGTVITSAAKKVYSLAKGAFNTLKSALSTIATKVTRLAGGALKGLATGLSDISSKAIKASVSIAKVTGSAVISGFKKLASAAISAGKALLTLGTTNSKTSSGFNLSFKNVLRYGLGIRSLYTLFNKIRSVITSTLGDISKVDTHTNTAISSMITAFNRLKASFGAAFQPIVTVVSPYVTRFLQLLTQMLNKTNEFIAILTGQSYYMRANVTETDYAKSLESSTKSTKDKTNATKDNADATKKATSATNKSTKATAKENDEMERQLASFDHLNILSDNSKNNDPTGGLSSTDPSDVADTAGAIADAAGDVSDALSEMGKTTYEKVPVTGISDFLTKIKEAITNGDWDGVGRVIAEKLNGILAKINELVKWDNIGEKVTKIIDSVTSVFNGLIDGLDWTLLGETVGNAVNTIVYALDTLLEGVDWANLGTKIGEGLNGLVETVNWEALGSLIGKRFGSALEVLYNIALTFDWGKAGTNLASGLNGLVSTLASYFTDKEFEPIGTKLADCINGLMLNFDWINAGNLLGEGINDFTDTVSGLVTGLEWEKIGTNIADGINRAVYTVKWNKVGETFGNLIKGALAMLRYAVRTFDWGAAGTTFASTVRAISKTFSWKEVGLLLSDAIKGAIEFLKSAASGFEWDTAGIDFADGVNTLVNEVPWKKLGETFGSMINIPFAYLRNAARKFEWETAGKSFADSVNALIETVEWKTMGESLNETLNGILDYINSFISTVRTTDLAAGIRTMLGAIEWDDLATKTWNAAKTAFQKAGSFLDTLFSESGTYNSLSSKQKDALSNTSSFLAERMDFDNRSLGEKIGDKIRNVLTQIPWAKIASNMWETAKKAMSGVVDFVAALFGVNDQDIKDAGNSKIKATSKKIVLAINDAIENIPDADLEGIGTAIGDALSGITFLNAEEIGRKIGLVLNDVPWSAIAEKAVELLRLAFSGMGNIFKEIFLKDIYGNEISIMDLFLGGVGVEDTNLGLDKVVKNAFDVMLDSLSSGAVITKERAKEVLGDIFAAGDTITGTYGEQSAKSFFEGFKSKYASASDETKSYLKPYMKLVFSDSQIEALERGDITMESFFTAMYSAASDGSDEMKLALASMLELMYSGAGSNAENSGKEVTDDFFDRGVIPEMQNKEGELTQAASDTFTNSLNSASESAKPAAESAGSAAMESVGTGMESANGHVISKSTGVIVDALDASRDFATTEAESVGSSAMESVGTGMQGKQAEVTQAATDVVDSAMTGAAEQADAGGVSIADNASDGYISETNKLKALMQQTTNSNFEELWAVVDADGEGESIAQEYYYALMEKISDNGTVKEVYRNAVNAVFGSPDALDYGMNDGKDFLRGLVNGANGEKTDVTADLLTIVDGILTDVKESPQGMDSHSPSKRSEKWGEYLMAGLVQGAENEESNATKKTTSVFSNVLTSVNSTFAGALLMIQKNIPGFTSAVETSFSGSLTKWNDVFKTGMTSINSAFASALLMIQKNIPGFSNAVESSFSSSFNKWNSVFRTGLTNMNNVVSTTMNTMRSTFSSQLSSIESTVSSRMNSIGNSVSNGLQSAMSRANGINWYGVGINIVQGIYNGINGWWGWLNNTVWNLAISLYNTARNALGIHSPSRLFRDGVGKMLGLGVAEGMEDSQPTILDSVTEVTDAIMEEMNNADTAIDLGIHTDNLLTGLDDVLTSFSDRVGSSFTDLIARLDAITNSVAFRTPTVAAGGLLPYNVSSNPTNGSGGLYGAQNGSDDLASVIIQSTNQAALAIVRAIERASEGKSLTKREMTGIVVDEINRQTRAMGQSPLLI